MQKLNKMDSRGDVGEKKNGNLYVFLQKFGETFMGRVVPWTLQQLCVAHLHLWREVFHEASMQKTSLSGPLYLCFNPISPSTGKNANDLISIFLWINAIYQKRPKW